jgi:fumarate reductase subunit C
VSAPVPPYTDYHPRWYRAPVSTWWWLRQPSYAAFILRELSSVFVAWSVVFLLLLVRAVGEGPSRYAAFLRWADTPWVVALNLVTLAFVGYHAVTWFALTPKAMAVRLRGRRLPGTAIAASAYAGWLTVSAFVAWLLLHH